MQFLPDHEPKKSSQRIYTNKAPKTKETKSLAKYYRDFLAGKVGQEIKVQFSLADGTKINGPVRQATTVKPPK